MPRFCTQCGAPNAEEARFCEQCGAPLRRPADPQQSHAFQPPIPALAQSPAPLPAASHGRQRAPAIWLVAVLAVLLVLSAALAWRVFGRDSVGPSQAQLTAAARQWMLRNQPRLLPSACLRNFDYAANPVFVSGFDAATQKWLDALVKAGIYTAPQTVRKGFLSQLEYRHGPQAATYIRDGALCAASGLALEAVRMPPDSGARAGSAQSGQAATVLSADWARAEVKFKWTGLAPWVRQAPFSAQFTQLDQPLQQTIWLHRTAQGWELASDAEVASLRAQLAAQAAAEQVDQAAQGMAGLWRKLTQAFGAQSEPQAQQAAPSGNWFDWLRRLFVTDPARKIPVEFYTAVVQGREQDAYALLGPQFQILGPEKMQAALQHAAEEMRAKGGLKAVTIDQVRDVPDGKRVSYTLHFGNGSFKTEEMVVGEVGGHWRILDVNGQ